MRNQKRSVVENAPTALPQSTQVVRIVVGNVWGVDVKFYLEDIIELDNGLAQLLIDNGQAKETKDDPTHYVDGEGKRAAI